MFVEHDSWSARCEDDAKIPGGAYFGVKYGRLARPFTPGHRYRITGKMGWSFLLTVNEDGSYAVSEPQAGAYLAKTPDIHIETTDPQLVKQKPVEVLFGRIAEFAFQLPVDYLAWEIPGAYEPRAGNRQVALPDGNWEMRGVAGWVVPLTVVGGKLALAGAPVGIDKAAIRISATGLALAPLAHPNRVTIAVPPLLGTYTVQSAEGKVLLPARSGEQTAALAPGSYKLKGKDWNADLAVTPGKAEAQLPAAQFTGTVTVNNGQLLPCRQGAVSISTPLGGIPLQLPDKETGATTLGLGWSPNNTTALLVCVTPTATSWKVAARLMRGGGKDWPLTARWAPLDQASPLTPPDAVALPAAGVELPIPAHAPSGAYAIIVETQPPASVDARAICRASATVALAGEPPASLWFAENRTAYRASEPVELCVWQGGTAHKLRAVVTNVAGTTLPLGAVVRENSLFTIAANLLSPGSYRVELWDGEQVAARRALRILPDELPTHFYIDSYGQIANHPDEVALLDSLGIQAFSEQGGTNVLNERRTVGIANDITALAAYAPEVGPASRYAPQGGRLLDKLDELGWKFFAQWSCAHQPYAYGMSFTDPVIVNRVKMTSLWASQYGRQHPSFLGINMFDEGGTPRGTPRASDDASYLEYDAFAKKFGRPKPDYLGQDDAAARAWVYDKQEQHNVIYSATGDRLADINALADPATHLYLGTQNGNLNSMAVDGGHPPIAYKAITLSPMHWYSGYIYTCFAMMGNEFNFMQPKPIEFFPLIWGCGHLDLTRHEVSLAISRQVDGVGYFHAGAFTQQLLTGMKDNPDEVKQCQQDIKVQNARLTRYGDFLRAVRRDRRDEVAVLYSLYDFAPKLFTDKNTLGAPYMAFRATFTAYLAMTGCLRAGIQAGVVCEEEILEQGGLAGRKALIIPGMHVLKPGMAQKLAAFMAGGGTVFTDADATVAIPGAHKLAVDFADLVDKSGLAQTAADGKTSTVKIDRTVLAAILPALEPLKVILHPLQLGSTDLLVTRQVNGPATYYYCVNDHIKPLEQLPAPLNEYAVQDYHLPIETQITVPAPGVVYDLFSGKELTRATGAATIAVKLRPGDLGIYAVLPEAVGGLFVGTLAFASPETGQLGDPALWVEVRGESGKALSVAVPLEIRVLDANGKELRAPIYRSTSNGQFTMPLRRGAFDPAQMTVVVRELLTGKKGEAKIAVAKAADLLTVEKTPVIVENGKALSRFLTVTKRVIVAIGDGPAAFSEADVQPLVKALQAKGAAVEVRRASELTRKTFDIYIGRGMARTSEPVYSMQSPGYEIDAPVIAVGTSADNALIRWVVQEHNFTRYGDLGFPGPARAYLVHVWQPFSLTDDSALCIAEDRAGLTRALGWMEDKIKAGK